MKIYTLPIEMVNALRSWFHPKDRSIILAPATFIEGEEIVTPAFPVGPGSPAHNRGRLYWKNGCWTQLDEFGNEESFCNAEWQDWSPTVTQLGNVTYNAATSFARYKDDGNTVTFRANLAITGAGTTGNAITIGNLPQPISDVGGIVGKIQILDSGTAFYVGALGVSTATSMNGRAHGLGSAIGVTPNFALANNDVIGIVGTYEKA